MCALCVAVTDVLLGERRARVLVLMPRTERRKGPFNSLLHQFGVSVWDELGRGRRLLESELFFESGLVRDGSSMLNFSGSLRVCEYEGREREGVPHAEDVFLPVLADAWQVNLQFDTHVGEYSRITNTRELKDLQFQNAFNIGYACRAMSWALPEAS